MTSKEQATPNQEGSDGAPVTLPIGEDVVASLLRIAREKGLEHAFVVASGEVEDAALLTLGGASRGERTHRMLGGPSDLVNLSGHIAGRTAELRAIVAREGELGPLVAGGLLLKATAVGVRASFLTRQPVAADVVAPSPVVTESAPVAPPAAPSAPVAAAPPPAAVVEAPMPQPAPAPPVASPPAPAQVAPPAAAVQTIAVSTVATPASPNQRETIPMPIELPPAARTSAPLITPPPAPAPPREPPPARDSAPTAAASPTASAQLPQVALPPKIRRPSQPDEFPEENDLVTHFHFGRCVVIASDGERLKLQQERDGRVREVAVSMLRIEESAAIDGRRHWELGRKN